jgi:signal transduction histidine kinase
MARLAHELNAPVSLIAGSLENLEHSLASIRRYIAATSGHRGTDPDLERVYRQMGVEDDLAAVSELLAICREGVGRIEYLSDTFGVSARHRCAGSPREMIDVASLLRRAVTFASATRSSSAAIELDLEQAPALQGDGEALSAAFINLVVNALDAVADRQSPLVRISLRFQPVRKIVEVRVRDNGPGIDAESQSRIFESFYTTKSHGAGLGLAIAREALEGHGGWIEVESNEGAGAELIVRLPVQGVGDDSERSAGALG